MKLSACLVVQNDERTARDCLTSLSNCVDEIIVVHDGPCVDKTLDIAKEYTDKISVHEHVGNNQPIWPQLYEMADGEWILMMDADEALSQSLRDNIRSMISAEGIDAYELLWLYVDPLTGEPIRQLNGKYKRVLFRKSLMYKIGLSQIATETRGTVAKSEYVLEHHVPFVNSPMRLLSAYLRKNKVRSTINAKYLSGDLSNIVTYNCSISDRTLKQQKKLMFQRRLPFLAIFVLPLYSFALSFFVKGKYRAGFLGFLDSLNLPMFHAMTCYKIIKYKIGRPPLA
jgi:glycosyltransferase involved in cell wall biosynthesis